MKGWECPTLWPCIPPRGAEEDRTPDLFVANEALSQLSYSPKIRLIAS